jgi:predicted cupin superfamily sugar epimerase
MPSRAAELIEKLALRPHPEGGFFREVFRSGDVVTPGDGRGARPAITTIYFLLTRDTVSRWHRVRSDEIWHLYEGGPLDLLEADLDRGTLRRHVLGRVGDADGSAPTQTVVAGRWQAARTTADYALMGCSVGPGFDYADFELLSDDRAGAEALTSGWPEFASLV